MEAFNDYTYRFLETIEKLGLTDYKVWNALDNLSKATMSKIRRGICGVSMNTLQEFCDTFNVNANYILTGKGSMFLEEENGNEKRIEYDTSHILTYDELVRQHDATIANYETLIKQMKEKFSEIENSVYEMKELFKKVGA